jgi:DNA-binding protein H-NS
MTESTSNKRTKPMATATLTYDELQEQIKKLTEQAEAVKQSEIEAVLTDMKAKIVKYGLTADQLGIGSAQKKTVKKVTAASKEATVLYRKGDLTWSGAKRGRKPKWVAEIFAGGGDIEKYRVK